MRLKSFHVRVFRNVIDSGPIQVSDSTCLVGKNEAGKSTNIEALHRLNPAKPTPFVLLDDYPRWLKKQHEIQRTIDDAVPITATFEYSDEEFAEINERFGAGVLSKNEVIAWRKYSGDINLDLPIDHPRFLAAFSDSHVPQILSTKFSAIKNSQELIKELEKISAEVTAPASEPTPEAQAAKQAMAALGKVLNNAGSLTAAVQNYTMQLIPKTFYFSNYAQLKGRYNLLTEVVPALTTPSGDEAIQTAADFLKLARISTADVQAGDFEQCNAELEAISSLLTRRVKENWKQNEHLKLSVKIETIQRVANQAMERFLQFRVEDTRHDFSSRLDRRSTGFQWFVSFIASFFEFEADKNLILLLDEPGLSLHARAQKDLLDAIDTNLTNGRQVIYTTHSPFMVRTNALDRVRIVEDQGPEKGATVTNDAGLTSDPDTLFPLQAALGYDIAQSLFIGNRNILLEGTSDFIYLSALSSHFSSINRTSIPNSCRLLPAGGATNIPTFIALLGDKLDVVVLLDGNAERQRIDAIIARRRLKASNVLSIETFANVKGADIEDLFEPDEYLSIYNGALRKSLKSDLLKGQDRIVKRIERVEGEFNHGEVAAYFLTNQSKFLPTLSPDTLQRFENLIDALVKALPSKA